MAVTASDIQGLPSGEFASVSSGTITPLIEEAQREVVEAVFGDRYDDGVKYLAAHLLAVMRRGSSAPATNVIQETAGPMTRMYAANAASTSDDALASTAYGKRYMDIRQQVAGGPQVL